MDSSKPADVTAAYAFLWAEDHGPWLFDTPQTGPKMQAMAERVMRAAQADPALFGRAVAGDGDAQQEFTAAVAPPIPGSGIETRSDEERALVAQRLSEGWSATEIQSELNARRAGGNAASATPDLTPDLTPGPEGVVVSNERRGHILDGDAKGAGGHGPGRNRPNKSEFPAGWSDDKIIDTVRDVANDPASSRQVQNSGRIKVTGTRAGLDIEVILQPDKKTVVTAYPTNVPRNPKNVRR